MEIRVCCTGGNVNFWEPPVKRHDGRQASTSIFLVYQGIGGFSRTEDNFHLPRSKEVLMGRFFRISKEVLSGNE